ncbi:hypothetical protein [Pseudomonas putida]|uniref:hypothetical protein n=1 Tax=Pseudomonas putida TaxID=303 RepID=UPI00301E0F77
MANNQDNRGDQGGKATGAGQQGGQGAGGMPNQQKGGQESGRKPEDKMNKDWDRSRDTGSQGGQSGQNVTDKQNPAQKDRMGGQQAQDDTEKWDKDR